MGAATWMTDTAYAAGGLLSAPWWCARMARTGKLRTDWSGRFGRGVPLPATDRPRVLLHAVSVGEVNAVRLLVDDLAEGRHGPPVDVVIATTTDTGFARATNLFAPRHAVVRYPFDFSRSVRGFLDRVRPDAVGLVELEVWPNFTRACVERGIPVWVVNGRLSERSAGRYAKVAGLVRGSFRRLDGAAVQDETYAERFRRLGMDDDKVTVTGTMKWDTAEITDHVDGAAELAAAMGIDRSRPLVVAGSTAPEEHTLLQAAVPDDVQLVCAPRRPEWFDHAAETLPGAARRSAGTCGSATHRFVLDTIGELRAAYALADLVVIGRSFGARHGSDMMEPIALGKPVIVGPAVADFAHTVKVLLDGDGIVQTTGPELAGVIADLLSDPERGRAIAAAGRVVIRAHQGATARHAELLSARAERTATHREETTSETSSAQG